MVKGWQTYPHLRGQVSGFTTTEPGRLSLRSASNHLGEANPNFQATAEFTSSDAAHDRGRSCDLERTAHTYGPSWPQEDPNSARIIGGSTARGFPQSLAVPAERGLGLWALCHSITPQGDVAFVSVSVVSCLWVMAVAWLGPTSEPGGSADRTSRRSGRPCRAATSLGTMRPDRPANGPTDRTA